MLEQRIIIIAPNSYEKEYADKLSRRLNASGYNALLWNEKDYNDRKQSITDYDKVIFFGKARKIEERARTKNVRIKFDRFGMRYGWAGNICTLYSSDSKLSWDDWADFVEYCKEMKRKYYDMLIPGKNKTQEIVNAATNAKNAGYRCQYCALLLEFFDCGGFRNFIRKANTENAAFVRITEQLPDLKDYDSVIASYVSWETLENRDGYKIQVTDNNNFYCFRIIDRQNNVIVWGKREYEKLGIMAFLALFEEKFINIDETVHTDKKPQIMYQTLDSLKPIEKVLEETDKALSDDSRTIVDSSIPEILVGAIPEVLAGFIGAGIGAAGSFVALYYMGVVGLSASGIASALAAAGAIIGGGMAAGIFVLGVPMAVLAVAAVQVVANIKKKELMYQKERLLQQAIEKQQAIIVRIKAECDMAKQRADYLNSLNEVLRRVINDLRADLEVK